MFQIVTSGRCRRLRSATDPHRDRLHQLLSQHAMFGSADAYSLYLQATLASRVFLESMLELSSIEALHPEWPLCSLVDDLVNDIADLTSASAPGIPDVIEQKRASGPADLATVIGTLYALEINAIGVEKKAEQALTIGFHGNYGARHLRKQASASQAWAQARKLVEITPFDNDDEERCMFAAVAALGAFEYNYHKVFNYVARQSA